MIGRQVDPGAEEGWRVIAAAVSCARRQLGDRLLSAYAIGSLAHGGFRRAVSDVDLTLLTDDPPERDIAELVATISEEVAAAAQPLGDRLSIFRTPWSSFSSPPGHARFPPIDRYDLMHYGILVHGVDLRPTHARAPSVEEIRAHAVDSALRRVTRAQLSADLRGLERDGVTVRDATKIVLWPVRLQHVCDSGQATGNAAAVRHYLRLPDARHRLLVQDALSWRDLSVIERPDENLRRITAEIHDLHLEVFQRIASLAGTPRRDELARRARELAA